MKFGVNNKVNKGVNNKGGIDTDCFEIKIRKDPAMFSILRRARFRQCRESKKTWELRVECLI